MRLLHLFKKDLAKEADAWVSDGIVEKKQAEQILARYGATLQDAHGMSIGYWALSGLAVLFAGLALIVFISANWDDIPRAVRMLSLIGLTVVTGGIGAHFFLAGKHNAGTLWLFFGGISYGVSIMLIAQIYHLGEHYPDGIFFWALGVLPLIFLTQSRLIALQVLVLATIWMFVEAEENFFPYAYALFAGAALWVALARRASVSLFMGATFGMITWLNFLIAWYTAGGRHFNGTEGLVPFNAAVSLLLLGLAHHLMHYRTYLKDYGIVLSLWLMRGLLVFMVVFSFENTFDEFRRVHMLDWQLLASMPLFAAIGFLLSLRHKHPEAIVIIILGVFFSASFVLAFLHHALIAAVLINLLLLLSGIWLIRRGVDEGATHYYYTGILVLLVTALCRYVDLIGDYVGASLMFLVAAGILFASARFWKKKMTAATKPAKEKLDDPA